MVDTPRLDLHIFESLPSTNTYLLEKDAEEVLASGYAVQALVQTQGRGRYQRKWIGEQGNMALSVYLKPESNALGALAFICAVAMAKTLEHAGIDKKNIALKWPNDVLVAGKKICGILIEKGVRGVVIGTGLNIVSAPDDKTFVNEHLGSTTTHDMMTRLYIENLFKLYGTWQKDGFAPIRDAWLDYAWHLGESIHVKLRHEEFRGLFKDLDQTGALIVEEESGKKRVITSAEIF